ncbi:MAG: hypothetical protein KTV68_01480 [Acidimicrobiia bacterium]|nr:hypothetical protein [Acidimicrobiia bacterium]MCY4432735.1 hypothetical protein [bacterium]
MSSERQCLGVPNQCDYSRELITRALDGQPTLESIGHVRVELANCLPCVLVLDVEVRFKLAMSQACRESAPAELQVRITETLQRVVLDDLDIEDF